MDENGKGLIIGFLGDNYEGKTYYINKIFKCNLSLEPTNNINYYYINKNIRIIDIPGTNKIILPKMNNEMRDTIFGYQKDQLLQDKILETKKKDFIIQKFIIDNSIINIMIISSFNLETKKRIGKLIRIFNENYQNSAVIKSLYIIHNNLKIKSDEDYNKYIENNFPKGYYYNKDNIVFTEKLNEEAEHKFEVLHFIPKSYKKEEDVIGRINEQIYSHLQINLSKFNEMISNSFHKSSNIIFNSECNTKIEDNIVKIEKKQKENLNEDEKISCELSSDFNKYYSWSSLKIIIPSYCCFIDENNDFVIQIVVAGFNKCNISYKNMETDYKFHIICKKDRCENKKKKIIQTNLSEEDIDYRFKIPITFIIAPKYHKHFLDKGMIYFFYKIEDFRDSIQINLDEN